MKKIFVVLMALILTLTVSGCNKKSVSVFISYTDATGKSGGMNAQMPESTLIKLMNDYAKSDDFSYELDADGNLFTVNGVSNDDQGYWEIYRNDELIEGSLKNVTFKDGDNFVISYHANVIDVPQPVGGWQIAEIGRVELSEEELGVFEDTLKELVGVDYEPVCVVATQVVAGRNLVYLARGTTVTANPESSFYFVTIYQDLEGVTSLTAINKIDIYDIAVSEDGNETLMGGWEVTGTGKAGSFGSSEAQSSFDKAIQELDGMNYNPIQLLATQLVAGMNYMGLAYGKVVGSEDNLGLYVLTWYADLEGNASITDIKRVNIAYYTYGL